MDWAPDIADVVLGFLHNSATVHCCWCAEGGEKIKAQLTRLEKPVQKPHLTTLGPQHFSVKMRYHRIEIPVVVQQCEFFDNDKTVAIKISMVSMDGNSLFAEGAGLKMLFFKATSYPPIGLKGRTSSCDFAASKSRSALKP